MLRGAAGGRALGGGGGSAGDASRGKKREQKKVAQEGSDDDGLESDKFSADGAARGRCEGAAGGGGPGGRAPPARWAAGVGGGGGGRQRRGPRTQRRDVTLAAAGDAKRVRGRPGAGGRASPSLTLTALSMGPRGTHARCIVSLRNRSNRPEFDCNALRSRSAGADQNFLPASRCASATNQEVPALHYTYLALKLSTK